MRTEMTQKNNRKNFIKKWHLSRISFFLFFFKSTKSIDLMKTDGNIPEKKRTQTYNLTSTWKFKAENGKRRWNKKEKTNLAQFPEMKAIVINFNDICDCVIASLNDDVIECRVNIGSNSFKPINRNSTKTRRNRKINIFLVYFLCRNKYFCFARAMRKISEF